MAPFRPVLWLKSMSLTIDQAQARMNGVSASCATWILLMRNSDGRLAKKALPNAGQIPYRGHVA